MVGRHTCQPASVHAEAVAREMSVPVDPVERKEWYRRGMGTANPGTVELPAQESSHRSREPFVEITDDDAGAHQVLAQDVLTYESAYLIGALPHLESEMHVEHVDDPVLQRHVDTDPPPRLSCRPGEIERVAIENGQPAEDGVPVLEPARCLGGTHDEPCPETIGQYLRLGEEDFLDADQIGADLREDIGDPSNIHAAIETRGPMDVVGRDRGDHACVNGGPPARGAGPCLPGTILQSDFHQPHVSEASHSATLAQCCGSRRSHDLIAWMGTTMYGSLSRSTASTMRARSLAPRVPKIVEELVGRSCQMSV